MSKHPCYCFVMIVALGTHALAGQINSLGPVVGPGTVSGVTLPSSLSINNDNAGFFPNLSFFDVNITDTKPVDLIVEVTNTSGTTEYNFAIGIRNHSDQIWHGMMIELGFGTGVDFIQSSHGDDLDFDSPDFDNFVGDGSFASFIDEEETIMMTGITWRPNNMVNPSIAMDVPDLPNGEFTLRFTPLPEPASIALLAMGSLVLANRRRRAT